MTRKALASVSRLTTPVFKRGSEANETTFGAKTDITQLMSLARSAFKKPSINSRIAASFFVLFSSMVIAFCGLRVELRALASLGWRDQAVTSARMQKNTLKSSNFTLGATFPLTYGQDSFPSNENKIVPRFIFTRESVGVLRLV